MRRAMGHTNIEETHSTLWETVTAEIIYVPSKQKYGRASLYGNKERLESLEQQFNTLRSHMGVDAKSAAKLEKKASVLLGGYMQRCTKSREAVGKLHDQIDQAAIELATFERLRTNEQAAIPARTQVIYIYIYIYI